MNLAKLVFLGIALLLIQACSHPIEIEGAGDVVTTSNGGTTTRGCTWEEATATPVPDNCAKNYIVARKYDEQSKTYVPDDYKEVYTAVPRYGWVFDSWVNCAFSGLSTENGNTCTFNVPAATVEQFWGETMPSLQAVFTRADTDGDGVYDSIDSCPNTPPGEQVDSFGCPLPTATCPCQEYGESVVGEMTWWSERTPPPLEGISCDSNGYGAAKTEVGETSQSTMFLETNTIGPYCNVFIIKWDRDYGTLDGQVRMDTFSYLTPDEDQACQTMLNDLRTQDPLNICP